MGFIIVLSDNIIFHSDRKYPTITARGTLPVSFGNTYTLSTSVGDASTYNAFVTDTNGWKGAVSDQGKLYKVGATLYFYSEMSGTLDWRVYD